MKDKPIISKKLRKIFHKDFLKTKHEDIPKRNNCSLYN